MQVVSPLYARLMQGPDQDLTRTQQGNTNLVRGQRNIQYLPRYVLYICSCARLWRIRSMEYVVYYEFMWWSIDGD